MKKGTPPLGQHFLNNPTVAHTLIDAAGVTEGTAVLEIGPGEGALTKELLARGARVVAVERDPQLVEKLHTLFSGDIAEERLTIIEKDVRDFDPREHGLTSGSYVLAANIPYYITGDIIRRFLTTEAQPRSMALLIQKEVAERIARDKKESLLSLSVKAFGTPRFVKKVTRGNFSPPPSVDSAILSITHISRDFFKNISEEALFSVLRAGFASKRKFLSSNLSRFGKEKVSRAFHTCGVDHKARAEDLSLETWHCLTQELT